MTGTLLVCDEAIPQPSRDTASLRMWRLLVILRAEGWELAFHPLRGPIPPISGERLRDEGIEIVEPGVDALTAHLETRSSPKIVLISRPQVAEPVLPAIQRSAPAAGLVYDTLELAHLRAFRQAKETHNGSVMREALRLKSIELELTRTADVTLTVSEIERAILNEAVPEAEVVIVPSIHTAGETPSSPREERRPDVVLVAYWAQPANQVAARVLVDDVWPTLAERDADLRVVLVGSNPPDWLQEAAASDPRIVVTGHVPDVAPYLDSAWCAVIPQTFGSGVKGKVLGALAHGAPTVGTTVAWEGIPVVDGVHGLVANDPQSTIDGVMRLRSDAELWNRLHVGGQQLVEEHFSFAAARTAIIDALDRARAVAAARA
jgi:glycosyltransferase involved in cell wall biosynthesis